MGITNNTGHICDYSEAAAATVTHRAFVSILYHVHVLVGALSPQAAKRN